jgi:hypothetical protein
MIRSRLEELSLEALLLVASHNKLTVEPETEREDLIDILEELIEENQEERYAANSLTVMIQQKKYSILREDEAPLTQARLDELELPDHYEINRITLMLRDPRWAFTYWDISSTKTREYRESNRFDGLYLRVLQLEDGADDLRIRDSFEIPVQLSDSSWYIYIPHTESPYRIQLVARNNHRRELLAVSNRVYVPNARLPYDPENTDSQTMALFELCGLEYLEAEPFGDRRQLEVVER